MEFQSQAVGLLEKAVSSGKEVSLSAGTDSMLPLIKAGEKFKVRKVPLKEIKIGSVVAFKKHGKIFVHRIVGVEKGKKVFTVKGDNALTFEKVKASNVLGKVVEVSGKKVDSNFLNYFVAKASLLQGKIYSFIRRKNLGKSFWFKKRFLGILKRMNFFTAFLK